MGFPYSCNALYDYTLVPTFCFKNMVLYFRELIPIISGTPYFDVGDRRLYFPLIFYIGVLMIHPILSLIFYIGVLMINPSPDVVVMQIITESGAKVTTTKTGIYKRWKERSHSKVSFGGSNTEGPSDEGSGERGGSTGILVFTYFSGCLLLINCTLICGRHEKYLFLSSSYIDDKKVC